MAKTRKAKTTTFAVRDPIGLNREFYRRFDPSFLFAKADALMTVVEHYDEISQLVGGDGEKLPESPDEKRKYLESLRAEVYFTEIHQFECLFTLMLAVFQPRPHWECLTTYETKTIRDAIQQFTDGAYTKLSHGKVQTERDFLLWSVYTGKVPVGDYSQEKWEKNLSDIGWVLQRIAHRYLDTAAYNSYKHGLRIMTGRTGLSVKVEGTDEPPAGIAFSDNSLTYLELQKQSDGTKVLRETTKHFSPEESFNHLTVMELVLRNIKSTRLAAYEGNSRPQIWILTGLERDRLLQLSKSFKMSLTV